MEFLKQKRGTSTVEWLVTAALIVAIVGGTLLTILITLRAKFEAVNGALLKETQQGSLEL